MATKKNLLDPVEAKKAPKPRHYSDEAADPGVFASLPLISVLNSAMKKKAENLLMEAELSKLCIETHTEHYNETLEALEKIQQEAGVEGLRFGNRAFRSKEYEGRETLNRELLIENGVKPETIAKSMKTGKPYVKKEFKVLAQ